MLLSTLPDLPGRTYDVKGVVSDCGDPHSKPKNKPTGLEEMFNNIIRQASDMGADAIIDIKMVAPSGELTRMVVIGTAVKLR